MKLRNLITILAFTGAVLGASSANAYVIINNNNNNNNNSTSVYIRHDPPPPRHMPPPPPPRHMQPPPPPRHMPPSPPPRLIHHLHQDLDLDLLHLHHQEVGNLKWHARRATLKIWKD